MKVFLGNAPWSKPGFYGVRAGSRWPHFERSGTEYVPFPFFLAYATAVLEEDGFDVRLVDAVAEHRDDEWFLQGIASHDPALIVLEISTISLETDLKMARAVRARVGAGPTLALCGLHAPMSDPRFLEQHAEIDVVMFGEYEQTLLELARDLREGARSGKIDGLHRRDADGAIVPGDRRPLMRDLDLLPWPARDQLPMHDYHDEPGNIPRPSVQMWASRGCPFECSFCAWPQIMYGNHRYRARDPIDVVDEMEWLVSGWGFRSVYFDDDTFNVGPKRIHRICEEIRARRLEVPWAVMARPDLMDEAMLGALREAGLAAVKYGVESGDQSIVDRCGKKLDLDRARRAIEITERLGILYHLTFMFGLPGETRESARRTLDFALSCHAESAQFTIATPFPGSAFHEQAVREGRLVRDDPAYFDGYHRAAIRTDELSPEDLEEIVHDAQERWAQQRSERMALPDPEPAAAVEPGWSVSVVIPHHAGRDRLRSCLQSVVDQEYPQLEILVVDSGSTDHSTEGLEREFPRARVERLPSNAGFAAAANLGVGRATGELIAMVNDDVRLERGWIESMVRALRSGLRHASAAAKVLREDDPRRLDSAGIGLTRLGYTFNLGAGLPADEGFDEPREVFGASAAAAMYRRRVFDQIGWFDELFESYLEDVDLSLRAQLHGYSCIYVPDAVAYHAGASTSGGQYSPYMVEHVARNTLFLLLKSMPRAVLEQNLVRIGLLQVASQSFHLLFTRRGRSHYRGLREGLARNSDIIPIRRRVLGARRVDDPPIIALLQQCERDLATLDGLGWKRRALRLLHG